MAVPKRFKVKAQKLNKPPFATKNTVKKNITDILEKDLVFFTLNWFNSTCRKKK